MQARRSDQGSVMARHVRFASGTKDARSVTPKCAVCHYPFLSGASRQARRCMVCKQIVCGVNCMCRVFDGTLGNQDNLCVACAQAAMSWLLTSDHDLNVEPNHNPAGATDTLVFPKL